MGKKFLGVIDQLYSDNTSAILVNDGITEQISLGRETRQGCPLSPVLFNLVIELLAEAKRNDDLIKDLVKNSEMKISLFSDNSLLTIKNPLESMIRIKTHLEKFGKRTGLCINWQKSEILLFNYNRQERERMIERYLLKVCKYLKYLGVDLATDVQKSKEYNFNKLKREIKSKLQEYSNLNLSWFRRIALSENENFTKD